MQYLGNVSQQTKGIGGHYPENGLQVGEFPA